MTIIYITIKWWGIRVQFLLATQFFKCSFSVVELLLKYVIGMVLKLMTKQLLARVSLKTCLCS